MAIVIVLVLASMLTIPAMAAERAFNLGDPFTKENAAFGIWYVDGDEKGDPKGLTAAMLQNTVRVEIEMPELEDGQELLIIFNAPGVGGWWMEGPYASYDDGVYTFRLGGGNMAKYFDQETDDGAGGSIWIGGSWWGIPWEDLGVTKATLFYTSDGGGAVVTGVTSLIALALGAFTFSSGAAFVVIRKIKSR